MPRQRIKALLFIFKRSLVILFVSLLALLPELARAWSNGQPAILELGQPSFVSGQANNTAWSFLMQYPSGITMDNSGTLWVADWGNNRVLRFANAASLANGANADRVLGQLDFISRGGATTQNGMWNPAGVAIDSGGTLWVADELNNRVLRFDHAASLANGANADGVLGQPDFVSSGVATSQNGMHFPIGVAVDSGGTLWVADRGNSRVLRFANAASKSNGANADGVLGQPNFVSSGVATSQNGMNNPIGAGVDNTGTLWVADLYNNRVLRFANAASKGNGANADGVLGQQDFVSSFGATTQNGMGGPTGVGVDGSGSLWVTDSDRVLRFDHAISKANGANADGVLGQPNFVSDGYATTQNGMYYPAGVAVDGSGTLWIVDKYNSRVLRFANAASKANGANADGVLGQLNFVSNSVDPVSSYGMDSPTGVALDPTNGKVFVADYYNNRVLRFAAVGSLSSGSPAEAVLGQLDFGSVRNATTQNGMYGPIGIAVDSSGTLWVADSGNNRVLRFDQASSKANGANADGALGQLDFVSNGYGTTQNGMYYPAGVAVDSSGTLWVADEWNNRVLRFDQAASKANGTKADGVLGQPNFVKSGYATTQNGMSGPHRVAVDGNGGLWVSDSNNDRVLRFSNAANKANGANSDGVLGQPDFASNGYATTQNGMNFPTGVGVDSSGSLWVSDSSNERVLRFTNAASKANGGNADGVLGQPDFVSGGYSTTQSGMHGPAGVAVDSSGGLWVADYYNNRVLYFVSSRPDTIGIFRPSTRTFYLRLHNSTGNADISVAFGPGTKPYPVVGDWLGTGYDTIGTFDQSNGLFSLCTANDTATCGNSANVITLVLGNPNDMPLGGKWASSAAHFGVGVFRPSNGLIYLKNALTTGYADDTMVLGIPGDVGLAGDWTDKGYDNPGVYRPSNSNFYLSNKVCNCSVYADVQLTYGIGGDAPVVGDWPGQWHDGVGLFRQSNGYTYLKNALTTGYADNAFTYGIAGDVPVAGHWQSVYPPVANPGSVSAPVVPTAAAGQTGKGGLGD